MSEIEETAKATQEVAKTVSKALDKSEKFGGFITKYFGTTIEQSIGIFNDKLKYWRWENQVNLISKANQKMEKLGVDTPNKQIPLKLGLPLIEAASLEDDNELQELWANLLVNSSMEFSLEKSYISVLEQLSSYEAQILISIYSEIIYDGTDSYRIEMNNYPTINIIKNEDSRITEKEVDDIWNDIDNNKQLEDKPFEPVDGETISMSNELKLALSNLFRLQCLEKSISLNGGEIFSSVSPTLFGAKLYEAVKEPTK